MSKNQNTDDIFNNNNSNDNEDSESTNWEDDIDEEDNDDILLLYEEEEEDDDMLEDDDIVSLLESTDEEDSEDLIDDGFIIDERNDDEEDDLLLEWLQTLPVEEIDESDVVDGDEDDVLELERLLAEQGWSTSNTSSSSSASTRGLAPSTSTMLEKALLQGVVPAEAGVGSQLMPGDAGFDPLHLAEKDYIPKVQSFLLNVLERNFTDSSTAPKSRPTALVLRDYREAEIRHGRLAMLAAVLWPLQEILDQLVLSPLDRYDDTFTIMYGGTTLPYVSLFMTFCMLLLGYLDIYANVIKEEDSGDAFLPGECFWDPLNFLDLTTAPPTMVYKMQEREIINGRYAMIAILFFFLQEAFYHKPLIHIGFWNPLFFTPAFELPAVQHWLDDQFAPHFNPTTDLQSIEYLQQIDQQIISDIITTTSTTTTTTINPPPIP